MQKSDKIRVIIGDQEKADKVLAVLKEFAPGKLEDVEYKYIYRVLKYFDGHRTNTAMALGISFSQLSSKLKVMALKGYNWPPTKNYNYHYETVCGAV